MHARGSTRAHTRALTHFFPTLKIKREQTCSRWLSCRLAVMNKSLYQEVNRTTTTALTVHASHSKLNVPYFSAPGRSSRETYYVVEQLTTVGGTSGRSAIYFEHLAKADSKIADRQLSGL